jgi:hypothetical protein
MPNRASLPQDQECIKVVCQAEGAASPSAAQPEPDLAAVIVVHGMGQQLQFETLDSVVEGLRRVDGTAAAGPSRTRADVRVTRVGAIDLPRVEMLLHRKDGEAVPIHLYEAYWAPLTEGALTLRDVMGFLWRAALDGERNAFRAGGFHRYMFDRVATWKTPSARWQLALAVLVLGALVILNAAASGIFASAVLKEAGIPWAGKELPAGVTLVVATMLVVAGLCVLGMLRARMMAFFFVLVADVVLAALCVGVLLLGAWTGAWPNALPFAPEWLANAWVVAAFWGGLVALSGRVRKLLVQFVGDVAAYITPHALDRFNDLRQQIKKTVRDVTDAVYADKRGDGKPRYARVAIVGHSLGSVAAYDALNGMIRTELAASEGASSVVERTCLLLTFGSPLDKTAFIFNAQGCRLGITREALAAAMQPMILDYRYRTFPWVNVYSKADIVSGRLDLYDDPQAKAPLPGGGLAVENVIDPKARTPLAAHTEYWKSDVVFGRLRDVLVRGRLRPSSAT